MASYISCTSLNTVTGAILRHLRSTTNKDQATVAESVNLPTSTISKLESGSANITIEYIYMLCHLYEISLTDFARIIELASVELLRQKVYIYVEKSESIDLKDGTVVVHPYSSIKTGALGILGGIAVMAPPVALGVGLITAYQLFKGNKKLEEKLEEVKSKKEDMELTKITGQQVYKALKGYLEGLDMENLAPNKE